MFFPAALVPGTAHVLGLAVVTPAAGGHGNPVFAPPAWWAQGDRGPAGHRFADGDPLRRHLADLFA